jgi:hypothetical protein
MSVRYGFVPNGEAGKLSDANVVWVPQYVNALHL